MKLDKPLGNLFNRRPDARQFQVDHSLPMSDKYVGIEIEAENIQIVNEDLNILLNYWDVTTDGSLRNYGTEFVSVMLRGGDIRAALEELNNVFVNNNINPDYSERTSVHIHCDTRFLNLLQLRTLILYYLALEPYIFNYIGHGRENNSYCIPYYKNNSGIKRLSSLFMQNINEADVINSISSGAKYEAMNVRSIREKGSIEFRHHYGTNDVETLYSWIKVVLALFRTVKQYSEADFYKFFFTRPYTVILSEILPYFPLTHSDIDLTLCEQIARNSISKLLINSSSEQDILTTINKHLPKAGISTTSGEF